MNDSQIIEELAEITKLLTASNVTARQDRSLLREANRIYKLLYKEIYYTSIHDFKKDNKGNLLVYLKDRGVDKDHFIFHIMWDGHKIFHTEWMGKSLVQIGLKGLSPWFDHKTVKDVVELIKKNKSKIIHEIVHEIDRRRIKDWDDIPYTSPEKDKSNYYNQPQEMNAFFLMALDDSHSKFDEIMDDVDSSIASSHQVGVWNLYDWIEDYGKNFNSFRKSFWSKLGQVNHKNFTPKTKRSFNKRVYDYWRKVSKEGKSVFDELLENKDEMALIMVEV